MGFGDGTSCNNQYQAPCAISPASASCYIPCGGSDINDSKTAYFLLADQALTWVGATSSSLLNVQNPIRILGPNNFMFGRAMVGGYYVIGKILYSNGAYSFQTYTNTGAVELTNGFDVLTCALPGSCRKFFEAKIFERHFLEFLTFTECPNNSSITSTPATTQVPSTPVPTQGKNY